MRMQLKIVALVAAAGSLAAGAVAWKAQTTFAAAGLEQAADAGARETSSLRKLARAKLEALRAELVRVAAARETGGRAYLSRGSQFEIVALAKPANEAGGGWTVAWEEKSPSAASAARWANGFDSTALASLPYARAKDGAIVWARVADAKGDPAFAILFEADLGGAGAGGAAPDVAAGKTADAAGGKPAVAPPGESALPETQDYGVAAPARKAAVVAILAGNRLEAAADGAADGSWASYLVDDRGFVASHPNKKYVGASFASDSLVDEIAKKQKPDGSGTFSDVDGRRTLGRYQAATGANLYAVYSASVGAIEESARDRLRPAIAFGAAAALAALAFAAWFGARLARGAQGGAQSGADAKPAASGEGERAELEPASPAFAPRPSSEDALGAASLSELADGIGDALRGPLASIIGNAQLARRKASDPESRAHAEAIERDARSAKDALERFARLADPEPARLAPTSVADAMDAALETLRGELSEGGVTVERRYSDAPLVMADAGLLQAAFARAIENAIFAMAGAARRTLVASVEATESGAVRARLTDTGFGMARDVRERAFEPFFKGFEGPGRLGLGLAFARHAFDLFSARTHLDSTPGEGTELRVEFPPAGAALSSHAASLINMKEPMAAAAPVAPAPSFTADDEPTATRAAGPLPSQPQPPPLVREPRGFAAPAGVPRLDFDETTPPAIVFAPIVADDSAADLDAGLDAGLDDEQDQFVAASSLDEIGAGLEAPSETRSDATSDANSDALQDEARGARLPLGLDAADLEIDARPALHPPPVPARPPIAYDLDDEELEATVILPEAPPPLQPRSAPAAAQPSPSSSAPASPAPAGGPEFAVRIRRPKLRG